MRLPNVLLGAIALPLLVACASSPTGRAPRSPQATAPAAAPVEPADAKLQTLLDQGYYHYTRGDYSRALHNFETVFLLDAQYPEPWARYLLFYCQLSQGDYRAALGLAEELVKSDPHNPFAYLQVGIAQLWLGQAAAALLSFQRALEFESHPPRVHFYRGLAHAHLGDVPARDRAFHDAQKEYSQILKVNPRDFTANYELAALYLHWDREVEKASRHLAIAKDVILQNADEELPPDRRIFVNYYVPFLEGVLLFRKGEARAALSALTESLANAPSGARADLAELYHYLGRSYLGAGDTASGRALLQKALALDPSGPYAKLSRDVLKR